MRLSILTVLAIWIVNGFAGTASRQTGLPEYTAKIITKLTSPDGKYIAFTKPYATTELVDVPRRELKTWEKHNDLYISNADGSNVQPLFIADYESVDTGTGVRYFSWSYDSKYLVFDFIVNNSARYVFDGLSFMGVIEIENRKGFILRDKGCEPRFTGKQHTMIEFLSFQTKLRDLPTLVPAKPQYHGSDGMDTTYYLLQRQRPVLGWLKVYNFTADKRKDLNDIIFEEQN